jgi:hypothetical protein
MVARQFPTVSDDTEVVVRSRDGTHGGEEDVY